MKRIRRIATILLIMVLLLPSCGLADGAYGVCRLYEETVREKRT